MKNTDKTIRDFLQTHFLRRFLLYYLPFLVVLTPFLMWLLWYLTPLQKKYIVIIDKTVATKQYFEHKSLWWVLTHQRIVQPNGRRYLLSQDYFGFFPRADKKFTISDLNNFNTGGLDSIAKFSSAVYYTDTYGVYYNEWYTDKNLQEHSGILYGGLDDHDIYLLKQMKRFGKLIIGEFNFMATPTSAARRDTIQNEFGLTWSGWAGRCFDSLDSLQNPELPKWVTRLYRQQHNGLYPFHKNGIVFVHDDGTIVILETKKELTFNFPMIRTNAEICMEYQLPPSIIYPYWFDITYSDSRNEQIGYYEVFTTPRGDSILQHYKIPNKFPAGFRHNTDYSFYYFCGDWTDCPVGNISPYLKGSPFFKSLLFNITDNYDRRRFFWTYYRPLISKIVSDGE